MNFEALKMLEAVTCSLEKDLANLLASTRNDAKHIQHCSFLREFINENQRFIQT